MRRKGVASLIAVSRGVAAVPGLEQLLGMPVGYHVIISDPSACAGLVAWGCKPSARRAERLARRHHLPLYRLEDGFLRSVDPGKIAPPLSVVVDDLGIYYDAAAPSRLERLIAAPPVAGQTERARGLMAAWRRARISKYNHAREIAPPVEPYVLVVDQTQGDASIRHGLADAASFRRMLDAALAENPDRTILVKMHPEVVSGRKKGHFDLATLTAHPRLKVLGEDAHPVPLIEHAEAVYVVTSQIGFEALLWGRRVRTFGMPFYAGWGLTEDDLAPPRERRGRAPLENLVHAALVAYPRYIDPETRERCEPERVIEWMGLQRRMRERFAPAVYAIGFSPYKRPIVRRFLQGSSVRFARRPHSVPAGATKVVWGVAGAALASRGAQEPILHLEDGFLRSVGLGADLVRPLSWVIDTRGIYYDATRPSDLEHLLQTCVFDEPLLARARALRERLIAEGLTKYNVGRMPRMRPETRPHAPPDERRVILVPGQVEKDAALAYGAPGIRKNLELLRAVRAANPDAYLVYKPHPDVAAGLRRAGQGEGEAGRWCDEIITDAAMGDLLPRVDEIHTMTSLTGFEALLRGKKVVCYGQPFYSGWGLTEDIIPPARRTRRLTLDELVAAALILYPTYVSRVTGRFTTPERALEELLAWRKRGGRLPWWRVVFRRVLRFTS